MAEAAPSRHDVHLPAALAALVLNGDQLRFDDLTLADARRIIAAAAKRIETQAAVIRLLENDVAKAQAERDAATLVRDAAADARKPFDDTTLLDRADHLRHAIVEITMPGYDDCAMRQVACCAIGLDNSGWPEGLATVIARWKAMDWPASNDRPRHAPIPDPREADDAPDLTDTKPLPAPSWMGAAPGVKP